MNSPHAEDVARRLRNSDWRAMEYYALADLSPRDPAKIRHPANQGWTSRTIDRLLDMSLLTVGTGGWHVHSDFGCEVYKHRPTKADPEKHKT